MPWPSSARRPLPAASSGAGCEVRVSPGAAPTPSSSHVPPTPPGSKGAKGHTGLGRQQPQPCSSSRSSRGLWGSLGFLALFNPSPNKGLDDPSDH